MMETVIIITKDREIDLMHEHPECTLIHKWKIEQMEERIKYKERCI